MFHFYSAYCLFQYDFILTQNYSEISSLNVTQVTDGEISGGEKGEEENRDNRGKAELLTKGKKVELTRAKGSSNGREGDA
jgi:hypothetical protein